MRSIEKINSSLSVASREDVEDSSAPVKPVITTVDRNFDEDEPEWEFYLERIAEEAPLSSRSLIHNLQTKPAHHAPIEDMTPDQYGLDARWANLFILCKNHIHSGEYKQALEVLEDFTDEFSLVDEEFDSRSMYMHLKSEILKNIGGEENLREAFRLSLQGNRTVNDHSGIQNNLGEIISTALSQNISISEVHTLASSEGDLIRIGKEYVRNAIDAHPEVSNYHATLGRLLAHEGEFKQGRSQINEAIRLADPDYKMYDRRVSRYQRYLSKVELQHQEQELDDLSESIQRSQSDLEDLQKNSQSNYEELDSKYDEVLRDFQTRNLQFIGFFAALVAVIIAIVDISISMPYPDAAGLILVLVGGVLIAFAGLQNVLPTTSDEGTESRSGVIANVILGIILVVSGLLTPSLFPI